TDMDTGQTDVIDVPCGATREDKCGPCAKKARRLRQVQIREGWHRTTEPVTPEPVTEDQKALITFRAHLEFSRAEAMRAAEWDQVADIDAAIGEVTEAIAEAGLRGQVAPAPGKPGEENAEDAPKRKRSTRRRQDAPELPRRPVDSATVGRVYTAPDGTEHRPSMWLTMTLDSYGPVREDGTPVNPARYDYRRAAWDAVAFPRLLDRFWQNLRRCVGWNVQYAGCVEPQRRLAPHGHFAIRGTIPRETLRKVAAATYHQVWWPAVDAPRYHPDGELPTWDDDTETWTHPGAGQALTSWDAALDSIDNDPDAEPALVARFGRFVHAEGVNPGTEHAERTVRYITKYLTKNVADCHDTATARQRAHLERLWSELRVTPCSDRCANWLLYGIAPKNAHQRLKPGQCRSRVHQHATLGLGGRRILISREWSGKTLTDHRHDARAWV
ncbi:MAG: replication initiator, partial [Micromonosporaceae bacterium]